MGMGAQGLGGMLGGGGVPETSILNPYNFNPLQQAQMGGMGYGMMNNIMQKLMTGSTDPLFTTGQGYQGTQPTPGYFPGINMSPIGNSPSIYSLKKSEAKKQTTSSNIRKRDEGSGK